MDRRSIVKLIGTLPLLLPPPAFAENAPKTYRLGVLSPGPAADEKSPFGKALTAALAKRGYVLGKNLAYEARGAGGHVDRLPRLLDELVASKIDALVTQGYPSAAAMKKSGTSVPTVSLNSGDPVGTGLVKSLAHPGGNLTGISDVSAELAPKRLELLKEVTPKLRRVAILWNADDLGMTLRYRASEAGAKALGITIQPLGVREPDDFGQAFAAMTRDLPDGIMMVTDVLTLLNRKRVFDFAAAHRLPAIYEFGLLVREGGLMSYGPDDAETLGRIAGLVASILGGAKPGDLPFEQPTRFDLFVNVKTAKVLGLTVPRLVLAQADEVIE
ncbi:MAG: ABC transporter substrate-binding protein [Stellaceae bacterium]